MGERSFAVSWDGKDRGVGKTNVGVPQGSPLSPVLFLIWMAPILEEMERRIRWEVGVDIELPSYVDDIHPGIYDYGRRGAGIQDLDGKGEAIGELLARADRVLKEGALEKGLPLEDSKEEKLGLRKGGRKKRKRNKEIERVKWLGVILDEDLEVDIHWKGRVAMAKKMLGALNGVGNSQWGISPNSGKSGYTGMVRSIATWGAKIGWRGQDQWRHEMAKLQYVALRKATGAITGARMESVSRIAGVESVDTCLNAMQFRFMARAIGDPRGLGDILQGTILRRDNSALDGEILLTTTGGWGNPIEWGGECPTIEVDIRTLDIPKDSTNEDLAIAIAKAAEGRRVIYSDGSKAEGVEGMVGEGWFESDDIRGGVAVGGRATVWDGKVAGTEGALRAVGNDPVLILSDSQAAIVAVKKAGKQGIARTRGLKEFVSLINDCEKEFGAGAVSLAWVKAHIGIPGNEHADREAKSAVEAGGGTAVREGGIRAMVKEGRKKERVVKGFSMGRVVRWSSRLAVTAYSQLHTGKGQLAAWRHKIGRHDTGLCRRCAVPETGPHAAVGCMDGENFGRKWSTWGQMDEKNPCRRVEKGEGDKEVGIDLVEEWHDMWWRRGSAKPVEGVG